MLKITPTGDCPSFLRLFAPAVTLSLRINPGSLENEQTFRLVGTVRVPEERPFFLLLAS